MSYHLKGEIHIDKVNVSYCFARQYCALKIREGAVESLIKLSTIYNNSASNQYCIWMSSIDNRISYCNIQKNSVLRCIFESYIGSQTFPMTIENSLILNNQYNGDLFDAPQRITIIHSICDPNRFSIKNTINMTTSSFVLLLLHIETKLCEAVYDFELPILERKVVIKCSRGNPCIFNRKFNAIFVVHVFY